MVDKYTRLILVRDALYGMDKDVIIHKIQAKNKVCLRSKDDILGTVIESPVLYNIVQKERKSEFTVSEMRSEVFGMLITYWDKEEKQNGKY